MDFYYSKDGQSIGPVPEAKFHALVKSGEITPQTSVWKEGMGDWKDYGEIATDFAPSVDFGLLKSAPKVLDFDTLDLELALAKAAAASLSVDPETQKLNPPPLTTPSPREDKKTSTGSGLEAPVPPGRQEEPVFHECAQCGGTFQEEEMITYEDSWICADCKPRFFQKLREEILADSGLAKAGWGERVAAKLLDGIFLVLFFFMAQIPVIGLLFNGGQPLGSESVFDPLAANLLWGIGLTLFYGVFFIGRYGATLGKRVFHLRVVNLDGSTVSYELALARCVVEFLSLFTLQNRICSTRVVKER
jgi:uncharacterized RDD family membrane protein YckC